MRIPVSDAASPGSVSGDRLNYKSMDAASGVGNALQGLGGAVSSLSAKMQANSQAASDYNSKLELEKFATRTDLAKQPILDASRPDGTDFAKNYENAMLEDFNKNVLPGIKDPEQRNQAILTFERIRGAALPGAVATGERKLGGYVDVTTEGSLRDAIATGQVKDLKSANDFFQTNIVPRITSTIKDPNARQAMIDKFGSSMMKRILEGHPEITLQPASPPKPEASSGPVNMSDYKSRIAQIESGGNPNEHNASGADGTYQIMPATARAYGITNTRDPAQQESFINRFTEDNRNYLSKRLGREPSGGELYLAHQQGAGGATALLKNPNALATSVIGYQAVVQNGGSPGMTAGQFASKWINQYNGVKGGGVQYAGETYTPVSMPSGGVFSYADPSDWMAAQNKAQAAMKDANTGLSNDIKLFEDNSLASYVNTGKYTDAEYTREDYIRADPKNGSARYDQYKLSKDTSLEIYSLTGKSSDEIKALMAAKEKGISTGENASFEWKLFNQEAQAANEIITKRGNADQAVQRELEKISRERENAISNARDIAKSGVEARKDTSAFQAMRGDLHQKPLTEQEFISAYGTDSGKAQYKEYAAVLNKNTDLHRYTSMSDQQIVADLNRQADMLGGSTNLAAQKNYYELKKGADEIISQRHEDPAGVVMRMNTVKQAYQMAAQSGWKDADAVKNYYNVSMAAQRSLGIQENEIKMLPKVLAKDIVDTFKDPNVKFADKVGKVTTSMSAIQDPAQRQRAYAQLEGAGLPQDVAAGITTYLRGDQAGSERLLRAAAATTEEALGTLTGGTTGQKTDLQDKVDTAFNFDGDAYYNYGFEFGTKENLNQMSQDKTVFLKSAAILMSTQGLSSDDAIKQTMTDMYGPNKRLNQAIMMPDANQIKVNVTLPPDVKEEDFAAGASKIADQVRTTVNNAVIRNQVTPNVTLPDVAGFRAKASEYNAADFGQRADGTPKGTGFLGVLKRADGGVSTEISVSTDAIGGQEFPLLVPTLTKDEVKTLLTINVDDPKNIPPAILQKAQDHAELRVSMGKSPFAGKTDAPDFVSSGQAAIYNRNAQIKAGAVMDNGVIVERDGGYAFLNTMDSPPTVIAGPDGKPMIWTLGEVLEMGKNVPPIDLGLLLDKPRPNSDSLIANPSDQQMLDELMK